MNNLLCYRLGLPMWANGSWIGGLFPTGSNSRDFLRYYSAVFSSVEGNTTFYALPEPKVIDSWCEQIESDFQFSLKLPRKVTHENQLRYCGVELVEYFKRLEPLGDALGTFMIQLPEIFSPESLDDLENFLVELPSCYHFSVEVRHIDFFNRGDEEKTLNQLLERYNIDRVCFDSRALFSRPAETESEQNAQRKKPRLPVHALATSDKPIIRFIASADFDHNRQFLLPWVKKLEQWIIEGKEPTFFIHTPNNDHAPQQAYQFHQMLSHLPWWQPLPKDLSGIKPSASQLSMF